MNKEKQLQMEPSMNVLQRGDLEHKSCFVVTAIMNHILQHGSCSLELVLVIIVVSVIVISVVVVPVSVVGIAVVVIIHGACDSSVNLESGGSCKLTLLLLL